MKYLKVEDIIKIHDFLIKKDGGEEGIFIDGKSKIESILFRMEHGFGDYESFETLIEKVAFLYQSLNQTHPFVDGTKRTAIHSSIDFLILNNHHIFISKSENEEVDFAIRVADKMPFLDSNECFLEIRKWFEERTFTINNRDKFIEFVNNNKSKIPKFKCSKCASKLTLNNPICINCGKKIFLEIILKGVVIEKRIKLPLQCIR